MLLFSDQERTQPVDILEDMDHSDGTDFVIANTSSSSRGKSRGPLVSLHYSRHGSLLDLRMPSTSHHLPASAGSAATSWCSQYQRSVFELFKCDEHDVCRWSDDGDCS